MKTRYRRDSLPSQQSVDRETSIKDFLSRSSNPRVQAGPLERGIIRDSRRNIKVATDLWSPQDVVETPQEQNTNRSKRGAQTKSRHPPDTSNYAVTPTSQGDWQPSHVQDHIRAMQENEPKTRKEHQLTQERALERETGQNRPISSAMGTVAEFSSKGMSAESEEHKVKEIRGRDQRTWEAGSDSRETWEQSPSTLYG